MRLIKGDQHEDSQDGNRSAHDIGINHFKCIMCMNDHQQELQNFGFTEYINLTKYVATDAHVIVFAARVTTREIRLPESFAIL